MTPNEHKRTGTPVPVPGYVRRDVLMVRDTGLTNMLDSQCVAYILRHVGKDETADWIEDNERLYFKAVFVGMEAVEGEG